MNLLHQLRHSQRVLRHPNIPRIIRNPQRDKIIRERPLIPPLPVLHLVRERVALGRVDRRGPNDPRAALDRRLKPRLGALRRPHIMRVVQRRRDARVQRLQQAGQLARVDVLGREQRVAGRAGAGHEVLGQRGVGRERLERRLPAVAVRVDEARGDDLVGHVDDLRVRGDPLGAGVGVEPGDAVVGHEERAGADHGQAVAGLVEGDDGAARQQGGRREGRARVPGDGGEECGGTHGGGEWEL